jgi:poly-gamma-glutamate capsule biosynthesis protein CapA/YwtB (metallophosphatase superfamily)
MTRELLHSAAPRGEGRSDQSRPDNLRLFLCGDVMTGRGIDQVLPHPGDPALHERHVKSARMYIELAECANGAIPQPAGYEYVWGDSLAELKHAAPAARIVNLETAITTSNDAAAKGINYRMNPHNAEILTTAKIDCCVLANNHVLDWGETGLEETLNVLDAAHVLHAGAGRNFHDAAAPGRITLPDGRRILVFAFGFESSGIPPAWAAGSGPGVNFVAEASEDAVGRIAKQVEMLVREGDVCVASIHWGDNWGYTVPPAQRAFAHDLIDVAGFHVVHGHSSHHAKAIEVYRGRLILYGCGDFITDYEGISGYERFRGDLSMMYLPEFRKTGELSMLRMVPFQMRRFRLNHAAPGDAQWLQQRLERESATFGNHVVLNPDNSLSLVWQDT